MNRVPAFIALWMALVSTALAQRPAEVTITHHTAESIKGYRVSDEFFLPLDAVDRVGWQAVTRGDMARVIAEGSSTELPIRQINNRNCIPLRSFIQTLGGESTWIPGYDTLDVISPIEEISVKRGVIKLKSTLGLKPSLSVLTNPTRVVMDLEGAKLNRSTHLELENGATAIQFKNRTVRVVMQTAFAPNMPEAPLPIGSNITLDVNTSVQPTNEELNVPVNRVDQSGQKTMLLDSLPIFVDIDSERSTLLSIRLKRNKGSKPADFRKPDPTTLEVVIPGVMASLGSDFSLGTDAVKNTTVTAQDGNTVVRFALSKAMGAEVWTTDSGIQIQLLRPNVTGSLAGKIIVLDPGHGGHDGGCSAAGVKEKDLTLAISNAVSAELAAAGATVIMTRKSDTYPTLDDRCILANRNNADLFLSIHINAPGRGRASPSGTQTYYHKNNPIARLLAECIHRELVKPGGLPNQGYKSDGVLYDSGLKVLRDTKMPGVLIECGFITHPTDRAKMQTKAYHQFVAKAVVNGIKVYLGQ